jgi:hypothetical protein
MIKKKFFILAALSCIVLAEGNAMGRTMLDTEAEQESSQKKSTCPSLATTGAEPFNCAEFFKDGFSFAGLAWWIICQAANDPLSTGMLGV